MLRKSTTWRLHWRRWRRQWGKVCGTSRRRRWRTGWFRHNACIAVVMGTWCWRRWIWFAIITILQAGSCRAGWQLGGATITIIAIRFTCIIWVGFIANICGARSRWRRLIDYLVVPVWTTWTCGRRWRWIDRIGYHAAAICCRTGCPSYVIAIIRVHAVPRVKRWHTHCIRNRRNFRDTLRFAQCRWWQWIRCLIILGLRATLPDACATELQQINNGEDDDHCGTNQYHKRTFIRCWCHAALLTNIHGLVSAIGAVLPAIAKQSSRNTKLWILRVY